MRGWVRYSRSVETDFMEPKSGSMCCTELSYLNSCTVRETILTRGYTASVGTAAAWQGRLQTRMLVHIISLDIRNPRGCHDPWMIIQGYCMSGCDLRNAWFGIQIVTAEIKSLSKILFLKEGKMGYKTWLGTSMTNWSCRLTECDLRILRIEVKSILV